MSRKSRVLATAVCVLLILPACAVTRGTLDISVLAPGNPQSGQEVKVVRVTDQRPFEVDPPEASIPSLKGDEIDDPSITSRAIARKRNSYGKAIGDILLPEGSTVEQLVHDALVRSFQETGYVVRSEGEPGYDDALPVEADIHQFWAWFTPGFWTVGLEFEALVEIKSPVPPFPEGETVRGYVALRSGGAASKQWTNTVNKGIEDLVSNIRERLESAGG